MRAAAACVAAVLLAAAPRAADSTAPELAAALQKKIDGIRDFSTDFTHTYQGGVLKKQITERGHLLVKKPGKMRWDYADPERKTFVSDGLKMYSYIPEDKQVIVTSVPPEDEASTPALVEAPAGMAGGSRALKLVPKARQRDYDWLTLVVDPGTLAIRGLQTTDAQGGTSTFSFTNLKENVGVADKAFAFKIPRGVDVVTAPTRP